MNTNANNLVILFKAVITFGLATCFLALAHFIMPSANLDTKLLTCLAFTLVYCAICNNLYVITVSYPATLMAYKLTVRSN